MKFSLNRVSIFLQHQVKSKCQVGIAKVTPLTKDLLLNVKTRKQAFWRFFEDCRKQNRKIANAVTPSRKCQIPLNDLIEQHSFPNSFPKMLGSRLSNSEPLKYLIRIQHDIQQIKVNMCSSNQQFKELISYAADHKRYRIIINLASQQYQIAHFKLDDIEPQKVQQILRHKRNVAENRYFEGEDLEYIANDPNWSHSQFKIFVWIAVIYAAQKDKKLSQFDSQNIQFLRSLFSYKSREFILYHLRSLEKSTYECRSIWTEEANDILIQLMRQSKGQLPWCQISLDLFVRSGCTIYKPRQKCRQQWTNHLSPNIQKGRWSEQQDELLMTSIAKYGKKWSQISKVFEGSRSQHMIKNRFNSLAAQNKRKPRKPACKTVQQKRSRSIESQSYDSNRQSKLTLTTFSEEGRCADTMLAEEKLSQGIQIQNLNKAEKLELDLGDEEVFGQYLRKVSNVVWDRSVQLQQIEIFSQECFHIEEDFLLSFLE